ncbi:MAG: hypothetical protein JXA14_11060 [Anaerolineae bacterium]|nr:hypothetical protein [Anaerolineae bacterium]
MSESKEDRRRGGRLKGVRKRKRARQQGFTCEVMAFKMCLVKKRTDEREK